MTSRAEITQMLKQDPLETYVYSSITFGRSREADTEVY